MKNPLNKRYFRELKNDFGKYIALCLFLIVTIGFCSGFLVADGSTKDVYKRQEHLCYQLLDVYSLQFLQDLQHSLNF